MLKPGVSVLEVSGSVIDTDFTGNLHLVFIVRNSPNTLSPINRKDIHQDLFLKTLNEFETFSNFSTFGTFLFLVLSCFWVLTGQPTNQPTNQTTKKKSTDQPANQRKTHKKRART